jgi:tetratricopeptide (TPR) repeat protein
LEIHRVTAGGDLKVNLSVLDHLAEIDQYARLDLVQQHLDQIQSQHIEYLLQVTKNSMEQDDLEAAVGISEIAVLCSVALDDHMLLATALTVRAQTLFALDDSRTAIHCSLQALNVLRNEYTRWHEIRDFFIEQDFKFGIALLDERVARGLEPSDAIDILNQVETIYERYGYELGLGYVHLMKGSIYKYIQWLEDALTSFRRALQILRQHQMHVAEVLLDLSYVCGELNQLEEAKRYLKEAQGIFGEEENELGLAGVDFSEAAFLRRQRQYRNLVQLYRRAYTVYQRHNRVEDVAFVEMNVATLLSYPGHQRQSLAFLESAIATLSEAHNERLLAKAKGYLALLHYSMGAQEQAKELMMGLVEESNDEVPMDTLWQASYNLGGLELAAGNLAEAYEHYQRAEGVIDSMRSYLRTEELIIDILDLKPDFYSPLVSLTQMMRKPTESLGWVEKAKSRAFLHLLGNSRLAAHSDSDAALLEQLNEMDAQLAILDKAINSRKTLESPGILDKWQQSLREKVDAREALRRQLKIQNAEVASVVTVQPLDWDEVQDVLFE